MSDILARARLLAKAANDVADQMSSQVHEYKAVVESRKADEALTAAVEREKKTRKNIERVPHHSDVGSRKVFKGAAISGSSLVTTYGDIRPFAPRGSVVFIDSIKCKLCDSGEWTASRVELTNDYPGDTNLDAEIAITVTAEVVKKRSPRKNKAAPVSSSDILGAVAGLDTGHITTGKSSGPSAPPKILRKQQRSPRRGTACIAPLQPASSDFRVSEHSSPALSCVNSTVLHQSSVSVLVDSPSRSRSSAPTSPRSQAGAVTPCAPMTATVDKTLEPEQLRMLAEIDSLSEEEQQRRRAAMHMRMADRGQQKAAERVAMRRQLETLGELEEGSMQGTTTPDEPRGHRFSEDMLQERRRLAMARVVQKRREEDRQLAEALKAEEDEKLAKKKLMKDKAERLRKQTAQRVAEYKAMKKEKALKEREAAEAELALKKEREAEYRSESHVKRLQERAAATEARLQKQKRDLEEKKYVEKLRMEEKLAELAAERQRTKNVLDYRSISSTNMSHASGSTKRDHVLPAIDNHRFKRSFKKKTATLDDTDKGDDVVISVQAGPSNFLPLIRKSTSEQSRRLQPTEIFGDPVRNRRPPLAEVRNAPTVEDDALSDDSLQNIEPRQLIQPDLHAPICHSEAPHEPDNISYVSALTIDSTNSNSVSKDTPTKKVRKKKKEVWKMKPIPVRPYIHVE